MEDVYHQHHNPELDQKALNEMVLEMKALPGTLPKVSDHEKEMRKARDKIMHQENQIKALQRSLADKDRQVDELKAQLVKPKNKSFKTNEEWERINRLAFLAVCAIEGVSYDRMHAVNPLRSLVWDTYLLQMNLGDRVQCCHCGKLLTYDEFTVEHLKPRILGGGDEIENLRPSCGPCNYSRPVEDISHIFNGGK